MVVSRLNRRISRRDALALLGVGGGVALIMACGAPVPAAPAVSTAQPLTPTANAGTGGTIARAPADTPTTSQGAQHPRPGGTLRWGLLGNIVTLDGHNYGGTPHIFHVFDRLVLLDEQLNWQPRLAESWDINADYTQIRLHLRQGVQYHTGREFTGDDVVWNFNRVKDPAVGGGIFASYVAPLKSVESPDKYTVVITTNQPNPYISHLLQTLNMLDPVTMQQPDGVNKPVGTGPFKFAEYLQGDHLTLVKNPNYWRSGLPYLDQLHIPIFADPQTLITSLEGGSIDAAVNAPLRDAARLQKNEKYRVVLNKISGASFVMQPNTTLDPTTSKQVRQALQYAIDRRRIADTVLLGFGEPNNLPWFPTSPAYDAAKNQTYAFDLEKARSLIQQAGGPGIQFDFNHSIALAELAGVGQIIQADLAKIGVTLTLKPTDAPQFAALQYGVKYNGLAASQSLFGHVQPGVLFGSPYYGPLNNWSGLKDDRFRAVATAMSTEIDPGRAKQAYADFNDYILDQSFSISITTFQPRVATSASVQGVKYDMAYLLDATEAWLS